MKPTGNTFAVALCMGIASLTAEATIRWQTTTRTSPTYPAAVITDQLGNPLAADPGGGSVVGDVDYDALGYFVQLIWAGPNGVIDPINTGTYVPGVSIGTEGTDDVVIDTSYIGRNRTGEAGSSTNPLGHIVNQLSPEVSAGNGGGSIDQNYYIRAFNAPVEFHRLFDDNAFSPVVGGGLAPGASSTRYGNSGLFTTSDSNDAAAEVFTATAFSTNLTLPAVPEAGTAGLAGLGLLVLRRFLRRKAV